MTGTAWTAHLPPGTAWDPGLLSAGGTLPATWAARWAADPSVPVLLAPPGDGLGDNGPGTGGTGGSGGGGAGDGSRALAGGRGGGRWCTAGELEERTRWAAARLALAGVAAGDRLLWSAGPSLPSIVAGLGALRLGAVVVPVNPAGTGRELAHVVADVRPAAAVVDYPDQARWAAAASPGSLALLTAALDPVVPGGVAGPGGGPSAAEPPLDRAVPGDPALVVYTSGTTGTPKGAVLTHGNLLAGTTALALAWRWTPGDRLVLPLPLFHVHGLCVGLYGMLAAGGSVVVQERFDAGAALDAAGRERATLLYGVPTMYHRLLASGRAAELARLRLCVSGSAPLPAPLWQRARDAAGVAVLERYGMTETMLTVSNPHDGERRPGTVGLPLPGVTVRVAPEDGPGDAAGVAPGPGPGHGSGPGRGAGGSAGSGAGAAHRPDAGPGRGAGSAGSGAGAAGSPGETGLLLVRGPSVFAGYWERPAATAEAFVDGWFRTGDVVAVGDGGYLSVRGRRADCIISGGFNVYPAEVEDVLLSHPGVAEVAVAGTPSDEWGEAVTAWVVPAGGPVLVAALQAHAAERLAGYKRPRHYRMVDALPRNAMGKVQRAELR